GVAAAVIAQQRQIAGALLGDQNVAVRQHQQTPRVDEAGRERRRREARRHLRRLLAIRDNQRPIGDDRSGLRRRQIGRIDAEAPPQLVFFLKILLQIVVLGVLLGVLGDRRLRARDALRRDSRQKRERTDRKRPNGKRLPVKCATRQK